MMSKRELTCWLRSGPFLIFCLLSVLNVDRVEAQTEVRNVAFTFDDVPGGGVPEMACDEDRLRSLTGRLLEQITTLDVPAIGLVTVSRVCDQLRSGLLPELLSAWLEAGLDLGNHDKRLGLASAGSQ
jgi:hypothetical protein